MAVDVKNRTAEICVIYEKGRSIMSLLRDIQNVAVDSTTDISTLLRKCKILAARLRNTEFIEWVDSELNGYEKVESLPVYRILDVESQGHFAGSFGRTLNNAPIPPSCLPKEFRDQITKSYLMAPISAYSSLIDNKDRNNVREQWPADFVALYAGEIYRDLNCISAWKVIPFNALVAIVDTIKTRILNFAMEIEGEAPDAGEAPLNEPPLPQKRVSQVFNTYISGTVQNVATGSSNFSQEGDFQISVGNFKQLRDYLSSQGLSENDIDSLEEAIEKDNENKESGIGNSVQTWIGNMIGKASTGAWNVSTSIASTLLGKALSKYFELN